MTYRSIGILTFHNANNYGAVLQTYALQKTLSKLYPESDTEVINYSCEGIKRQRSLLKQIKNQGFISAVLHYPQSEKRIRKIDSFCRQKMNISPIVKDKEELSFLSKKYDIIITGSDQIWNPKWNGNDNVYFQDFHNDNNKKISYAASFGNYEPDEKIASFLKQYKSISVREKSSKDILYEKFGIVSQVHPDPTLLLDMEDYRSIAVKHKFKKPYILCYMVPFQKSLADHCSDIAKKEGLISVTVSKSLHHSGNISLNTSSVEEILGLFCHAECIVTNSFHGTAFALINNKKLVLELNNPRGFNTRSYDLLKECGIISDCKENLLTLDCSMNNELNKLKERGLKYLSQL